VLVACSLAGILLGPAALTFAGARRYGYGFRAPSAPTSEDRSALLSKGLFFFATVIGELLILQSDAFVIGAMLGAAAVPLFILPATLWMNFVQAQNIFLRPLWPVLSHRYADGEAAALRQLIRRWLALSAGGAAVFALGLVLCGDIFIRWWSKGVASLPPVMAWGFGVYAIVASADNLLATCLNAFGMIEFRFGYTLLLGVVKVGAAVAVVGWASLEWLPWAFAGAMAVTSIPFAIHGVRRALRGLEQERESSDPA
jgi:O-antigen/teichoic acid export membrane protein